jgi:Flp pilus assembly protein protease CpaA
MLLMILALFVLMHVLIGLYDFSFYRIPNVFLGALLVLYAFYATLYLDFNTILYSLVIFVVIFALGFALYALKAIGAGDAKYIAVASLWFGLHGIVPLLFLTSVVGGGLAIVYLIFRDPVGRASDWTWSKIQKAEMSYPKLQSIWVGSGTGPEREKRENIDSRVIPYGVAIATGSIIMLMINSITH